MMAAETSAAIAFRRPDIRSMNAEDRIRSILCSADGRIIAGFLCCGIHAAVKPPGHGMEPEETAIQTGDGANDRVFPPDMSCFVSEDRSQFIRRPRTPAAGQDDLRPEQAYRHRRLRKFRFEDRA
jgi:hypothetical protein